MVAGLVHMVTLRIVQLIAYVQCASLWLLQCKRAIDCTMHFAIAKCDLVSGFTALPWPLAKAHSQLFNVARLGTRPALPCQLSQHIVVNTPRVLHFSASLRPAFIPEDTVYINSVQLRPNKSFLSLPASTF